jgi:hypothetical protein
MADTVVERDSSPAGIILTVIIVVAIIAGGAWVAYKNGAFGPNNAPASTTVIENNRTIERPAPAPVENESHKSTTTTTSTPNEDKSQGSSSSTTTTESSSQQKSPDSR